MRAGQLPDPDQRGDLPTVGVNPTSPTPGAPDLRIDDDEARWRRGQLIVRMVAGALILFAVVDLIAFYLALGRLRAGREIATVLLALNIARGTRWARWLMVVLGGLGALAGVALLAGVDPARAEVSKPAQVALVAMVLTGTFAAFALTVPSSVRHYFRVGPRR